MTPRLSTSVLVSALVRKAEADGGFAAVLAKGDPETGAIVLILLERGEKMRILERLLTPEGRYAWAPSPGQISENVCEVPELVARRRRFDPDLGVLELDVPSVERFAAEMSAFD